MTTQAYLLAFGTHLRKERKRRNLTLFGLSERTGISAKYIGELERGGKMPSFRTMCDLANSFGISVGDFFDWDERRIRVVLERIEKSLKERP